MTPMMAGFAAMLIFAAVIAVALGVAAQRSPARLRLQDLRRGALVSSATGYEARRPPLRNLVASLGGFLPGGKSKDTLRTGLVRAGYRRADSIVVFLGSKLLLALLLPLAWMGLAWLLGRPAGNVAVQAAILGLAGFYLPTWWLWWRTSERRGQIRQALPDALDLMVVCVEAGQGLGAAIQRVAQEMELLSPALSDELILVNQEMLTGVSRTDALRRLADRTDVDDVYSLVAMLIHSERLGTSIAQSLRAHAQSMRTRRRQRAEQMARKAAVKMVFPLVFLILPALLVVILGPAAIQLIKVIKAGE